MNKVRHCDLVKSPEMGVGVLSDIVEHCYSTDFSDSVSCMTGSCVGHSVAATLRPIQATVGQAFPSISPGHTYGRALRGAAATSSNRSRVVTTFSAHVQPDEALGGGGGGGGLSERCGHSAEARSYGTRANCEAAAAPEPRDVPIEYNSQYVSQQQQQQQQQLNLTSTAAARSGIVGAPSILPVGGGPSVSVHAVHQWTAEEFEFLYTGYYNAALPPEMLSQGRKRTATLFVSLGCPSAATATVAAASAAFPPVGEAFFDLLFQCLRSTVNQHKTLAVHALLLHLQFEDIYAATTGDSNSRTRANGNNMGGVQSLRERCIHGPNCAPFLFHIIELMASSRHRAVCELAAACLVCLLRHSSTSANSDVYGDARRRGAGVCGDAVSVAVVEAIGQVGAPLTDGVAQDEAGCDGAERDALTYEGADGADFYGRSKDIPFSDISEMLRGEDVALGLEKLGLTSKLMSVMHVLLLSEDAEGDVVGENVSPAAIERGMQLFTQLLLCADGASLPRVATRIARDPSFLQWAEAQLTSVVLGDRALADSVPFLSLLHQLSHTPASLESVAHGTPSMHETWVLFITYVCSTNTHEARSMNECAALLLSFLILRAMMRHGPGRGVVYDCSDVLFTDGMRVGASMVLEMWLLHHHRQLEEAEAEEEGKQGGGQRSKDHRRATPGQQQQHVRGAPVGQFFKDAVLNALHFCQASNELRISRDPTEHAATASPSQEVAAQQSIQALAKCTNMHFVATYLEVTPRAECFTLSGTAVDTQREMQKFLASCVLDNGELAGAFARLTQPVAAMRGFADERACLHSEDVVGQVLALWDEKEDSTTTTVMDAKGLAAIAAGHNDMSSGRVSAVGSSSAVLASWQVLAYKAAVTHAHARAAAALARAYPAISRETTFGYAAALAAKFEFACLRVCGGDVAGRLRPDELCTMAEVLLMLQQYNPHAIKGTGKDRKEEEKEAAIGYCRDAQLAALFLTQGIAVTKHCLDVAPRSVACLVAQGSLISALGTSFVKDATRNDSPSPHGCVDIGSEGVEAVVALTHSLEQGVALAVPRTLSLTVTGAPRPWAVYPLYNPEFCNLDEGASGTLRVEAWARWMLQILGLHKGVKRVIGWDALLSHTLLWVLAHRATLFAPAKANSTAKPLCMLLGALSQLLPTYCSAEPELPSEPVGDDTLYFSAAASRAIGVTLSDYADLQSEEAMPLVIHMCLALVARHCDPSTALALLTILLATPVSAGEEGTDDSGAAVADGMQESSRKDAEIAGLEARLFHQLHSSSVASPHGGAAKLMTPFTTQWSLENVVSLLELAAPTVRTFDISSSNSTNSSIDGYNRGSSRARCVLLLTNSLLLEFLQCRFHQRQVEQLSFMEKEVLRSTLEELDWRSDVLWLHVER